jgi:ABC-2 type transport system ATP-binding protein
MKPDNPKTNFETAVKVDSVYKSFRLPTESQNSIKNLFISGFKKNQYKKLDILNDINFEVKKGDFFGIVGRNGSGKSTLLKLLAGIYTPNTGKINLNGRLTPFIELGVGFNMELTGKENVYLNGALLGFSRKEMSDKYDEIVKFAELKKFMDQKLKNYSSGMQVRLAFSIAIQAETEILLIDEVLAVGDTVFQKKCFNYFKELKKNNKTVILVSHDTSSLIEFCNNGILIEGGKIVSRGKISDVVNDYLDVLNKEAENKNQAAKSKVSSGKRWGSGDISIVTASTLRADTNRQQSVFTDKDDFIGIKVKYKVNNQVDSPIYGITICDASGKNIFSSNTKWLDIKTDITSKGEVVNVYWKLPNIFDTGIYYISPAAADSYGSIIFDWRNNFSNFEISKKLQTTAIINTKHNIIIS